MKYEVYSEVKPDKDSDPVTTLEVVRSDRKTAEQDADILKTILHKKPWVQEC